MSAVIDTNILIYDTFDDTSLHEDSKKKLDELEKWIIPSLVFHEYTWFMKAENIPINIAKEKTLDYLNHEKTILIPDEKEQIIKAIGITRKYREYNDNIIITVAKKLKAPLLTYDKKLRKRANEILNPRN